MRSVYLPLARDVFPDALEVFDFVDSSVVAGVRETTNVPSQALFLLNSTLVSNQAQKLADRIMNAYPGGSGAGAMVNFAERINFAYWLVLSRPPSTGERDAAQNFLAKFPGDWKKTEKSRAIFKDSEGVKAAWTSLCRALFASSDFRYVY